MFLIIDYEKQKRVGCGISQDRQCKYNLTLRRFRATTVAVEKQRVLHTMSACLYP
jgi:hypothetical protein